MSTLYEVEITSIEGPEVELRVRSMQPDSSPLYETERFALALLCDAPGHEESELGKDLPPESVIAVSEGNVDPSPYIEAVYLETESEEVGSYRIVLTSDTWTQHLTPGEYESVAWDQIDDMESVFGSGDSN